MKTIQQCVESKPELSLVHRIRGCMIGCWATAAIAAGLMASVTTARAAAPVSDDFHGSTLNSSLWTFVNPVGDGTVSLNGTDALLTDPAGTGDDVWKIG